MFNESLSLQTNHIYEPAAARSSNSRQQAAAARRVTCFRTRRENEERERREIDHRYVDKRERAGLESNQAVLGKHGPQTDPTQSDSTTGSHRRFSVKLLV